MINSYKGEYFDLFKSIFDDAENGICIVDFEGRIIELNTLYADMFGYDRDELIYQHYSKLISDDSLPVVEQNHQKIFNGSSILKAEEKVRHKNGTYFYVHTSNLRVNDEKGNKLRITTAIDVTNRLRNELIQSILLRISNLTNHNTPTEELFKSVHEAVCKLLPIKNFTVCVKNEKRTEFPYSINETGQYNEKELQAEYDHIMECKKSIVLERGSIENLIKLGKFNKYDPKPTAILGVPLIVKNEIRGALIIKDYSKTRFTKEDKELLELVADQLARVIERKKYEEDLINAKRRAEEAVRLKSDFLAQISHEIRTPLNSILSFSALLKSELEGKLSPELSQTFNYIERGGNRLTRTIDLILNVSNSKNNQYKIRLEEINLNKDIFEPLMLEFADAAKEKGIDLLLIKSSEDVNIICDQYSINQLFANLLENAIKYTNKGSVTLKIFVNKLGKIQVDIEDTGIGISNDYIPSLFDPFSQEEQGYTRSYEGIGLGLSLVKSYAELNNAEIQVESKKDIGTLFSVIFN